MIRRASRIAVLGLALVGSGASSTYSASHGKSQRMERTPGYILRYCRRSQRLPLACPHLLPGMEQPPPHWDASLCLIGHTGCAGLAWDDLDLDDAGYGNRPPIWSHISIYVGNLATAFPFPYPTHGPRATQIDGLFARPRSHAIFLGSYTWGGKHGTVILAPDYPTGGEQGNHLIFRWRQAGVACAVGLHGWEPLSQAFATLHRMVGSIS